MGSNHTCGIRHGELYTWGLNYNGVIGDGGTDVTRPVPTRVAALSNVSSVAAGPATNCAISDELLYCWGLNENGELGNGSMGNFSSAPLLVNFAR